MILAWLLLGQIWRHFCIISKTLIEIETEQCAVQRNFFRGKMSFEKLVLLDQSLMIDWLKNRWILFVFLFKHELRLEHQIPNITILFDFCLRLGKMMVYILLILWWGIFRTSLGGIGIPEQKLSYEKSLRWHSAKARTCFPLEQSPKEWVCGFFRFLESPIF